MRFASSSQKLILLLPPSLLPSFPPSLFQVVAEQVFDNAMVAAGLLDDSRVMLPRLNKLIERLVKAGK